MKRNFLLFGENSNFFSFLIIKKPLKKVLILAYDFPPYVSVGGLRPYSWYKYFKEYNVYPIVVTRNWETKHNNHLDYILSSSSQDVLQEQTEYGTIIKTPYKANLSNKLMLKYGQFRFNLVRKLITAFYDLLQFIFIIGPKCELYNAADNYLKKNNVDSIIATGDPFVLFSYAHKLSKKYNINWIADYRDPWSQNLNIKNNFILNKWHLKNERKSLSNVYCITTVSDFLVKKISEVVGQKIFYVLPNGYNPDIFKKMKDINQNTNELTIAFVGSIYDWHPLRSFFKIISEFLSEEIHRKLKLNFYGINLYGNSFKGSLSEIIELEFPNLKSSIKIFDKIPNDKLLMELAEQNVMLLFNYYSYMGTKIFDYIALKRQILFCFSNDLCALELKNRYYDIEEIENVSSKLQEELLKETNSGIIVENEDHLKTVLLDLYNEFQTHGYIKCDTINADKYSRKHQVKKLAEIILEMK